MICDSVNETFVCPLCENRAKSILECHFLPGHLNTFEQGKLVLYQFHFSSLIHKYSNKQFNV